MEKVIASAVAFAFAVVSDIHSIVFFSHGIILPEENVLKAYSSSSLQNYYEHSEKCSTQGMTHTIKHVAPALYIP